MSIPEAYNILVSAAREFKGTAKDHELITAAAMELKKLVEPFVAAEDKPAE